MQTWTARPVPALPGAGGTVRVHDTAAGALAPVAEAPGAPVRMYVCGITPYDATHMGHAATYVAFDLLHRVLLDAGHAVHYVQNVTDVDDPLLERATATGVDWRHLADVETALFATDMAALDVLPPQEWVGAVEAIPSIVPAVEALVAAGAAYAVEGDVYFSVAADPRFGEVSHLGREQMLALFAERGGDPDREGKRDPLDALLWRAHREGEPSWDGASLGPGRPGWHVECVVIARDHLGPHIDVQGGGSDLVFPHHEMGAAHGHALDGPPFARRYVHAGMVGLEGTKMSKSRGNLVLVSRLRAQGTDPAAIRLALLAHHYRSDWSWSTAGMAEATARAVRWRQALARRHGPDARPVLAAVRERLADDLDAPGALAAVDAWVAASEEPADDAVEGAPDLVARTVGALLGVRL
ncbi:MAG: L-cysteine:1D-myo-inosityl 2-amino-2-deoxy-alpha-D-glucopyranoside ligase MshC [uncultured Quadrisphaera sp.]|uniref:L-cysteine:1D-myo-inositol 2-amino-2-deoxy-alpha-D-glucopyranoside ligase n=1 Tax=uncultured Quadrisphaera sp. TaxID=904978 RepID=A0A6J4PU67_9ACTN|nr:MAG: L-cysteine:1D-myo-inosityl 2-amino-2-deoxy-alpha-D-glucopyranoside ligase MshC [uncultured Quadrisphaera sp.]